MLDWNSVLVQQDHMMDMRHEAAKELLLKQAQAGAMRQDALRYRALRWLGGRLVAWGQQLQGDCGALSEPANTGRAEIAM